MQNQPNFRQRYPSIFHTERINYNDYLHFGRFSPPATISMLHYHKQVEIGLCLEGSGIFIIDEQAHSFTKGDISVIFPSEVHIAQSNPDDVSTWQFVTIFLDRITPAPPEEFFDCIREGKGRVITGSKYPYIQHLIKMLCYQLINQPPHHELISHSLITAFFPSVVQLPIQTEASKLLHKHYMDDVLPAVKYITQHYNEEINIAMLARLCHCSETQLRRLFNMVLGTSPMNYLHDIRIEKAVTLLMDPDISITEVSLASGYNTLSSFNRHFKDAKGLTPTEFRKAAVEGANLNA